MRIKKNIIALISAVMISSIAPVSSAAELQKVTTPQVTIKVGSNNIQPLVEFDSTVALLHCREFAYAQSYSNIPAYYHSTMCSVNNNGQSITSSGWTTLYNSTLVSSARVYATSNICIYTATSRTQHTVSSNVLGGTTSASYN